MSPKGREIRVGLVILSALAVLAAGIFLIGEKNNVFSRKNLYYIEFNSVSGLKPGNPVQLNGVDVGAISKVELPANPWRGEIRVWIKVESEYAARIRGPQGDQKPVPGQTASVARIKTLGLLGDKYIEIGSGSPGYPVIPSEGQIPAAEPTNVDALFASGEDVMDNVVQISSSLNKILTRMERGEGLLGELTSDSESGRRLKDSLIGTSETLQRVANKIDQGQGPLPRLLNDKAMANQLAQSMDRLQGLLTRAESGEGLLPALLNDPNAKLQLNETLASLRKVAQDLQAFTADLEKSDALLPRLVKDKEYGRQVTEQLRQTVENLNTVSRKLSNGNGTAAKLINDPQIYDAVNDIIIGVNESRILRWLIRNRQKKGIETRYDVTKQAIEKAGGKVEPLEETPATVPPAAPPPTPEPAPTPPEPAATPPPA
ncbi:MAG: phospholipid/cholesterol/gamma-HCH transport system substrate-binding protein [Acidobacteriota bacterium]|jgi:phospholipid/cholesterol/gamma-HCH transport system substrate-binding protein|nr:phospholipid/cholesterol/gamma-HCH transport system substrate-binding protein [Acidobacteriota bacterium]